MIALDSFRALLVIELLNAVIYPTTCFPLDGPPEYGNSYDYIIVGGGTTGLVVANRLTEDSNASVLVIEHGKIDTGPRTRIPYYANFLNLPDMYPIYSAPEPNLGNASFLVTVADVVGGGSVVNGMAFDHGSNSDYDSWELLGNEGWGWDGLKDYFKKFCHFTPPSTSSAEEFGMTWDESAYGNGPVQVSISSYQFADIKPIFDSWKSMNVPLPKEGFAEPIGAYWMPNSIDNKTATRSHSRTAYYDPVASRRNLHLLTEHRVYQILFQNDSLTAAGVEYESISNGTISKAYANKEVILAAGGVFSPWLLQLNGIGPRDVLEAARIPVKRELPGVGANFQDHTPAYMVFNLSNVAWPNPSAVLTNATFNASAAAQYDVDHTGPWSTGSANSLAMLTMEQFSNSTYVEAIVQKILAQSASQFLPASYRQHEALLRGFEAQRNILIKQFSWEIPNSAAGEFGIPPSGQSAVVVQKPLSRGTITLNATHPRSFPITRWNTFQNPVDVDVMVQLVRWNHLRWSKPALARYSPIEAAPGEQYQTDEEIIRALVEQDIVQPSFAHPSGACALMPEELGGVVGTDLLVYGTGKLSIVDASILPMIPATHLQAPMYAVAEKAADIIKARG